MTERKTLDEPARRDDHPGDGATRGTGRMEAFADAVFAIAFTLPIVHIELPERESDLWPQLIEMWPSYLGYALSALVIGTYWVHHHFSGAIYRTSGHSFLLATTLFLAAIGFISFPSRMFAEHVMDPGTRAAAAQYYVVSLAVTSLTWLVKWTVGRKSGHVDDRLESDYVTRLDRQYRLTGLAMTIAAALVFVRWEAGLALASILTLYFLRAPETPRFKGKAPTVEGEE